MTTVIPSSSALAPTTSADAGPSDEEIQAILTDLDAKEGAIFVAFKKSLQITPEIDRMITEAFGPGAEEFHTVLTSHLKRDGAGIKARPGNPVSTLDRTYARSKQCFVIKISRDVSPMLDFGVVSASQVFKNVSGTWFRLAEISDKDAEGFEGGPCAIV